MSKKCEHEIGYNTVTHNGITHPSGEQICLNCKKSLKQIITESYNEGYQDAVNIETGIKP